MTKANPLTDILPAKVRKYLYLAYVLAGLIVWALSLFDVSIPHATEILAAVGGALGLVAGSNVRHTPPAL